MDFIAKILASLSELEKANPTEHIRITASDNVRIALGAAQSTNTVYATLPLPAVVETPVKIVTSKLTVVPATGFVGSGTIYDGCVTIGSYAGNVVQLNILVSAAPFTAGNVYFIGLKKGGYIDISV